MSKEELGGVGPEDEGVFKKEDPPEIKAWKEKIQALQVSVGHEINNPLTPVIGNLHFWGKEQPCLADSIEEIAEEAWAIQELVAEVTQAPLQIEEEKDFREHFLAIRNYFINLIKRHTQALIELVEKMPDDAHERKKVVSEQAARILSVCEQFSQLEADYLVTISYPVRQIDLAASLEAAARAKEENQDGQ